MMLRQLRHRRGRAVALGSGVLVAAVAFSLLTAAVTTSQARTVGVLRSNLRPAYDILVRPRGARTPIEKQRGLVADNYLSGIYGGITMAQYHKIKALPGVGIAAPIEMIGYVLATVRIPVNVTSALGPSGAAVATVTSHFVAANGLSRFPARHEGYAYVTPDPLKLQAGTTPGSLLGGFTETLPSGKAVTVCPLPGGVNAASPFSSTYGLTLSPSAAVDGTGCLTREALARGVKATVYVYWSFPMLLAAIDPVAENKLVGLGATVTSGRYLRRSEPAKVFDGHYAEIPVLASSLTYDGEVDQVSVSRLAPSAVTAMREGLGSTALAAKLGSIHATRVRSLTITAPQAYRMALSELQGPPPKRAGGKAARSHALPGLPISAYWQPGPVTYRPSVGGSLSALAVSNPLSVWQANTPYTSYVHAPAAAAGTAFRHLREYRAYNKLKCANGACTGSFSALLHSVGQFDPQKLPGFNSLSAVPMQTYYPPIATGANTKSRSLLRGKALLPDGNLAGYLQQPPLLLTTLTAAQALESPNRYLGANPSAPISVVRVRVAGLHGSVRQQLDRVAQVAAEIRKATGLAVDVTAGSSPTQVVVNLPAGKFGRPPLALGQGWVRKGVTLVILRAADRKSLALFVLILMVCVLFLANGTLAAVRSRRAEIGVLRAFGWRRRSIQALVLGEVAVLGALAGLAGTGLSAALIGVLGLNVPWWRVGLVAPVAVVLATLAGLVPAWRAGHAEPLDAIAPPVRSPRRAKPVRSLAGLAASNLRRVPGRALLAASALGLGVTALTVLLAIQLTYAHDIGNNAMGGFLNSHLRGVDLLSAGLAIGLGAAAVADVTYLNLRERSGELATLAATGWQATHVRRVLLGEAGATAAAGAIAGGLVGLVLAAEAFGQLPAVTAAALAAAAGGVLIVLGVTAIVLGATTARPVAGTLADDE